MTGPIASRSPDVAKASLILEMQADHDATEMLLDAYSSDEWITLRSRIAAISAVMMLIERADNSNHSFSTTHPKAATRIFQLLGHIIDMPMYSAHPEVMQRTNGLPHTEKLLMMGEYERFAKGIVVPAFFDAVLLAKVANAQSIANDLGDATAFFQDIQEAKLLNDTGRSEFVTVGAQQWARLIKCKM